MLPIYYYSCALEHSMLKHVANYIWSKIEVNLMSYLASYKNYLLLIINYHSQYQMSHIQFNAFISFIQFQYWENRSLKFILFCSKCKISLLVKAFYSFSFSSWLHSSYIWESLNNHWTWKKQRLWNWN